MAWHGLEGDKEFDDGVVVDEKERKSKQGARRANGNAKPEAGATGNEEGTADSVARASSNALS